MSRRLRFQLLALLAVVGLLFSACGDDDDVATDDSSEEQSGDPSSEEEAEDAAEEAVAGEMGSGECGFLAEFATTGFGAMDPTSLFTAGEPVDLGEFFAPFAEELSEVADAAPSDIAEAFGTLADAFDELVGELEGVVIDPNDPSTMDEETMARMEALGETFDDESVTAASEEIETWIGSNCAELAEAFDMSDFSG